MDRGDTTQGLGNPGENVDSYFHPLPSSLFSVQTRQALEIEGKFASSTKKRQSHLANPGSNGYTRSGMAVRRRNRLIGWEIAYMR